MQTSNRAPLVVSTLVALASLGIAGTTLGLYFQQADALARLEAEREHHRAPAALTPEASPSHEHEPEPVVPGTSLGAPALPTTPPRPPAPLPAADLSGPGAVTMADVVERVVPSVVNITTSRGPRSAPPRMARGRRPPSGSGDASGSGVIISDDGLVVTNHHVVAGAMSIEVHLSDGRDFPATVVGTDPQSDIALLRLTGDDLGVTALPYGESSEMRQGDVVLAIGNPFGVGQTVTMGIVSATGRADMGIAQYEDFIQTDAAINPGNSGGALVSLRGELVGINTAILSRTGGSHGIGFAIPSAMVRGIVESLLRNGQVSRGWLGVTIQQMEPELAAALHLEGAQGALVTNVEPGSPAAAAGIAAGDLIARLDGELLRSTSQLTTLVATRGARAQVRLDVMRDGQTSEVEVTLGERPRASLEQQVPGTAPTNPGPGYPRLAPGIPGLPPGLGAPEEPVPQLRGHDVGGLSVLDLDVRSRALFRIPSEVSRGAVVVGPARPGSPGELAGLEVGDVILEVNQQPVSGVAQFAQAYARAGGSAILRVQRGRGSLFVLMR